VKWRYEFNVKSLLTPPIVWFIANVVWGGYMRKALALAKTQVERSSTDPSFRRTALCVR